MSEPLKTVDRQQRIIQKVQALLENDTQFASLVPLASVGKSICTPGLTLAEVMDKAFEGYADREAVGSRDYTIVKSLQDNASVRSYQSNFKTITYAQLQKRIHAVANVWKNHPDHAVKPDERVCIFGFTSVEFTVLDFATAYVHAITVPMQTATSHIDIDEVFDSIKPATVAVTVSDLVSIAQQVVGKTFVRNLVVFEYDERDDNERETFLAAKDILHQVETNIALTSLQDLESLAGAPDWEYLEAHSAGIERTASIVHSSGSTGKAKAAMVSEKAVQYYWTSVVEGAPPSISLCLAPFSHLLGKGMLASVLKHGGTAYFTLSPDMSTLFEDIRIVRPTFLGFFPRIIELIYQHYQNEVARCTAENNSDEEAIQERIKREMGRSYLGDRLCFSLFGGSQISPPVREFFADCFGVTLLDAYGNTEGGAVATNGIIQSPPVTEYRLRDVPELGYYSTDKPFPRGELCFKSIQSISGYYDAPEATKNLFDKDGFICTGDIVEEHEANHIAIIDRRNDVLKLSQGEYVPVGALGSVFEGASDVISQIYIYGNSQRSYLLAVVVPNKTILAAYLGDQPDDEALENLIQQELQRVAREEGVKSFEVPKSFIIESELFSETNGLLSGLRKKVRPALARKYGDRLEAIYDSLEQVNRQKRKDLIGAQSSLSLLEILTKLLEVDLNIRVVDSGELSTFYELGGDSLGAMLFSASIEEILGVELPADMILSPTGNLQKWTDYIERVLSGSMDRPTFASIHGKDAINISSYELNLSNFFGIDVLDSVVSLSSPATPSRTVFLTGANGFLGRFVCLAWLEKLVTIGGTLICVIRATDNASARARLDAVFTGLDPKLASRYKLACDHLEVVAGDVGEARMGLGEADYQRLSMQVDRVVHVAAKVNHRFSYADLFGANVLGTAETIRFALLARKKSIDFISSIAVYSLLDTSQVRNEDSPLCDNITLSGDYAAGYGASKWAGEQLLQQAHRQYGLEVNVFRGDMMLPHQLYKGQANTADMFIRLIYSIIHTGLAPYSFFALNDDGTKVRGHYDGLPVDVVATCVVGVDNSQTQYRTYNIENYHRNDGISLDTFVDWIEEAGHPVSRITDYQEWFKAFKQAHGQLLEDQQKHSVLEIIDAFAIPQFTDAGAMGCDHFQHLVDGLLSASELPHLTQNYIEKCLQDMSLLSLIAPVTDSRSETKTITYSE
jgi:fatty acid CoA ligase FadD9